MPSSRVFTDLLKKSLLIAPHGVYYFNATIWLGLPAYVAHIPTLTLEYVAPSQSVISIGVSNGWKWIGRKDKKRGFSYKTVSLSNLKRGVEYTVNVKLGSTTVASCIFETLPLQFPIFDKEQDPCKNTDSTKTSNRPFTVLIGSCFHHKEDKKMFEKSYLKLYKSNKFKPHLKFFLGDQVYVDQPPTDFLIKESSEWLTDHFFYEYVASFGLRKEILNRGSNVVLGDDHEFWNDYPYTPLLTWPALRHDQGYRNSMKIRGEKWFLNVQWGRLWDLFGVDNVSFCTIDTRYGRDNLGINFMNPTHLQRLEELIKSRNGPLVLALSEPIFSNPVSTTSLNMTSDHHYPSYMQYYTKFLQALSNTNHDIVILAGDVHFSRVADTYIQKKGSNKKHKLIEIVSSPLSLLSTVNHLSKGQFRLSDVSAGKYPSTFPQTLLLQPSPLTQNQINYKVSVRSKLDDLDRAEESFTTLSFQNYQQKIKMTVKTWLIRRQVNQTGLPMCDNTYTYTLE